MTMSFALSLFRTPLSQFSGMGPKRLPLAKKLIGGEAFDALLHFPTGLLHRKSIQRLQQATSGETITIPLTVLDHHPPARSAQPYRVVCTDEHHVIDLIFFGRNTSYLQTALPVHQQRAISGTIERRFNKWQMSHPDHIGPLETASQWCGSQPTYPLSAGLTQKFITSLIQQSLKIVSQPQVTFPEWLPPDLVAQKNWPSFLEALALVHAPKNIQDLSVESPARARLAFDEIFAHQVALFLTRQQVVRLQGTALVGTGALGQKLLADLPFKLTASQQKTLKEIQCDMGQPYQMLRLLQGDVGSGKTIVAVLAMLTAIEAEYQTALLAPTDLLAQQHAQTISDLVKPLGVSFGVLTGRTKAKERKALLGRLSEGDLSLLVGTHALLESEVRFKNLGLAVIDEQHRFGVKQRLLLSEKTYNPDLLSLSATPIPRTLLLSSYGDLTVSTLSEKPAGRQPVKTTALPLSQLDTLITAIRRAVQTGARIYWICPLISESEVLDLTAAEKRYEGLQSLFGDRVGLVHGQLKPAEKDRVMAKFAKGALDILIATTVVEVGIDVPEATIMVIEGAERFGLAQLHQLRGRVGRNTDKTPSSCVLMYGYPLSETARKRLEAMRNTTDGFKIAETDLKLRGGGDILGTRQSGLPVYRTIDTNQNLFFITQYLMDTHRLAQEICGSDPELLTPRGQAVRVLLSLFKQDVAIKYTRSA